jgi:hypothetical protein
MIFLVGFDFEAMAAYAAKIGGYFEKGIYEDRVLGVEAETKEEALQKFLDKRKNWIREEEKRYILILAATDSETWENQFYRNEYSWMKYLEKQK